MEIAAPVAPRDASQELVTEAAPPRVSVVLPIYNERENLEPLFDEIEEALRPLEVTFEIVAVDDGSTDGTGAELARLAERRPYLRVVTFRRNAGQSAAFDAGFRYAAGAIVVTMDADRQNDPHDIGPMLARLDEGFDAVVGWRKDRKDDLARTVASRLANLVIQRVAGTKLHDMGCSLRVCRREITDDLHVYGESHRFLSVMLEHVGARVAEFVVNHRPRVAGKSKYGFDRIGRVLMDLVSVWYTRGYQTKPIYVFGRFAMWLFVFAVASSAYVLYEKFALGVWVHRNPLFLMSMIAAVTSVQLMFMGLISESIMRTYFESQRRPSYYVARVTGGGESAPVSAARR